MIYKIIILDYSLIIGIGVGCVLCVCYLKIKILLWLSEFKYWLKTYKNKGKKIII
jgi:hypothetical protein